MNPTNFDPARTTPDPATELADRSGRLWTWLAEDALPTWWRVGADHSRGGFHEAIGQNGEPAGLPRRCRLHPRQVYSYALAAKLGWTGPAGAAVRHGLDYFLAKYRRPDGLFRASVDIEGRALDDRALLYDQAFALLGLYGAHDMEPREALRVSAAELLDGIRHHFKHSGGGFREADDGAPFQSNAQMHLFEACIAWGDVVGGDFTTVADELGALCLERLIDRELGVIDEYYDADWRADGPGGERRIEPGHQFEWAWLLGQWQGADESLTLPCIETLFQIGESSVDRARNAAPAGLSPGGHVTDDLARLWPQTERLRTATFLAGRTEDPKRRAARLMAAIQAADCVLAYLDTPMPGLWRDKLRREGGFVDEPAPASSLYHLAGAIGALRSLAPKGPPCETHSAA
jgi:mannose-6-phosphate isomerase